MGLFPMVYNLPVTFTCTVDKKRKIFKFTQGNVVGWTLDIEDESRVRESLDFEIVLQKQPKVIFIRRAGEGMPQHEDCEPEVYALKPRSSDSAQSIKSNQHLFKVCRVTIHNSQHLGSQLNQSRAQARQIRTLVEAMTSTPGSSSRTLTRSNIEEHNIPLRGAKRLKAYRMDGTQVCLPGFDGDNFGSFPPYWVVADLTGTAGWI